MKVEHKLRQEDNQGITSVWIDIIIDGQEDLVNSVLVARGPSNRKGRCEGIGHLNPQENTFVEYVQALGMLDPFINLSKKKGAR